METFSPSRDLQVLHVAPFKDRSALKSSELNCFGFLFLFCLSSATGLGINIYSLGRCDFSSTCFTI